MFVPGSPRPVLFELLSTPRARTDAGRSSPNAAAIATRSLQREMVGSLLRGNAPDALVRQAMRWARKIGVLSYVGTDLLEQRFGRDQTEPYAGRGSGTDFEVESWLEHLAQKFVRQFDPWSYWTISRAMDLFDFGAFGVRPGEDGLRHRGATDTAAAARRLELERALVIGVREDLLFPVDQQRVEDQLASYHTIAHLGLARHALRVLERLLVEFPG